MRSDAFTPKAYVKEGCPFSFKFLVFMTEAGLLDRLEVIRMDSGDPGFEARKARLSEELGKPATFPTVEVEPGRFMSDSDALIEHYAAECGKAASDTTLLAFYKDTIFPKLIELHKLKTAGAGRN